MEPANVAAAHEYASRLRTQRGVKRVDSLVTVLPNADAAPHQQFSSQIAVNPATLKLKERYASGPYTLLNIDYDGGSQSKTDAESG
jgi:hypothetical protein